MQEVLGEIFSLFNPDKIKETPSVRKMYDKQAALLQALNEKQESLFHEFYDAEAEFLSEREQAVFSRGFKIGAQVVMELLQLNFSE